MRTVQALTQVADLVDCSILIAAGLSTEKGDPAIIHANPALVRLIGHECDVLIGRPVDSLFGAQTEPMAWRAVTEALRKRRPLRTVLSVRHGTGHFFPVRLAVHPVRNAGDRRVYFLIVLEARDPPWDLEQETHRPGGNAQVLPGADQLPLALFSYIDRGLLFRFANRGYHVLFPQFGGDIVGRSTGEVYGPAMAGRIRPHMEAALAGGEVSYENSFVLGDGRSHHLLVHYIPDRRHDGSVPGFFVVAHDITDRKQAEEGLAASECKLKEAQRIAGIGWWEHDLGTDCTVWSENLYAIWGRDPQTFTPTVETVMEAIHPEDRAQVMALADATGAASATGLGSPLEFRILRPDGEERCLVVEAHLERSADGRLSRIFGVTQDITERKRIARELQAAKLAAEQANQAKSRFLASASHDLRQPLNAMSLLLGVLRPRVTDTQTRQVVDRLRASLDTMMELFNALLDISKFETGAVEIRCGTVPVNSLFQRVEEDFATMARVKGLSFKVIPCSCVLWTDATLLERMVRNLVSNAIRYTEQGGVRVGCRRHGNVVRIDVVDSGPGIPPEQRDAIFEEFHQLDGQSRHGHGLGLSIVKRSAELLGHTVEVASTVGRGSRFSVLVPSAAAPCAPASQRPIATPSLIVLVEDDPLVGMALQLTLEHMGCETVLARTGQEAEDLVAGLQRRPLLVIADFRLPGGQDGIETVAKLRQHLGGHVPACLITGDLAPSIRERAGRAGIHFLSKPIQPEDLSRLLEIARLDIVQLS